ncbi:MAG TPA: undecaprenyl-diphosphate phosphatase [Rhabdochlamydiaceae bacterium]|nr:undecaprenyl-diphosphate phosphatase [Rhabdochlamydiaceae bacterium]
MHWLHALILGIVQGLTEFFPISSSAHLKIVKDFLDIQGDTVLFDLFCHMGTFIALLIYFRNTIHDLLFRTKRRLILFIVALIPLIPFYFLLKPIRETLSQSQYLGFCLIGTASILFLASHFVLKAHRNLSVKDAVWIGTLQCVALIPGISRSAATIGAGLWRGVSATEAVQFSFLLSLPAVAGGTFLELLKAKSHLAAMPASLSNCFIGFTSSAIVGFFTVKIAIPLLQRGILRPFAWYCLIAGILISIFMHHG